MRSNTNIELVHFEYGVSGRHSSERSGDRQPLPILFLRKKNFKKEVVIPRIRLKNRFWTMTATDIFIELVPEHLLKEKSRFTILSRQDICKIKNVAKLLQHPVCAYIELERSS
jgi:hypothetical protein